MTSIRLLKDVALGFIGTVLLYALIACTPMETAGTSSEVDNPSLEVSFVENGSERRVTGSLGIFEPKQNPITHPKPRKAIAVENSNTVTIPASDLPVLAKASSGVDSTDAFPFNLVLETEGSLGGVLYDLTYLEDRQQFAFANDTGVISIPFELQTLVNLHDTLPSTWDTLNARYFCIPGTPFRTVLQDSILILNRIPVETFDFLLMNDSGGIYRGRFTAQNKFGPDLIWDSTAIFHPKDFIPIMDCRQESAKLNSDDIDWLKYQGLSQQMFMECPDIVCENLLDRLESGRTFSPETEINLRIQFANNCPFQKDSLCTELSSSLDSLPGSGQRADSLRQKADAYFCQDHTYLPSNGSGFWDRF